MKPPEQVSDSVRRLNPSLYGRKPMQTAERESDLHEQIRKECAARGWIGLHGSMAHRTHRSIGEADWTILASGGRVFFIECKTSKGKLSPAQLALHAWAERLGHKIFVARSLKEFCQIVAV